MKLLTIIHRHLANKQHCFRIITKDLLAATGVGLAPGAAFGDHSDDYLRLCFAASLPKLEQALDRIEGFMTAA
jgi:aspartate/methionine/tyrosine aminotransferase